MHVAGAEEEKSDVSSADLPNDEPPVPELERLKPVPEKKPVELATHPKLPGGLAFAG